MIPAMNITAWSKKAPWAEQRQVEQDLMISRAIVELFSDTFLAEELRFRGGTALNKLHFPEPLRYSEDIDLVRTTEGPIKPVLRRIRKILEPWLGEAAFDQSPVSPKLIFRAGAEDGGASLRLKVEVAIWEIEAYAGPAHVDYVVENPWFSGRAAIPTYSREEMLATKLRALLQRSKGRDLLDLSHGLDVFDEIDATQVVELFLRYLHADKLSLSRAQAEERMFAKLRSLATLTREGLLVRLGVGVYAKAKPSVLSGEPIPVRPLEVLAPRRRATAVFIRKAWRKGCVRNGHFCCRSRRCTFRASLPAG